MNNKETTANNESTLLEIHYGSNSLVVTENGEVVFNSESDKLHFLN